MVDTEKAGEKQDTGTTTSGRVLRKAGECVSTYLNTVHGVARHNCLWGKCCFVDRWRVREVPFVVSLSVPQTVMSLVASIPCLGLPRRRHLDLGNLVHTYFIQLRGSEMMFA